MISSALPNGYRDDHTLTDYAFHHDSQTKANPMKVAIEVLAIAASQMNESAETLVRRSTPRQTSTRLDSKLRGADGIAEC